MDVTLGTAYLISSQRIVDTNIIASPDDWMEFGVRPTSSFEIHEFHSFQAMHLEKL